MRPFLEQVVRHYYKSENMERLCFVLPNKRSSAFFLKYLGECAAEDARALMTPEMVTMNDFFYRLSATVSADQVNLLLELYGVYKKLNPSAESLDDFIFWGNVILADFNDVDKYLVRPEALFANVADYRRMQDTFSYLDEKQLKAIEQFVSHFTTGGRYKDEFRRIWNLLLPLYRDFNAVLAEKGLSYEGMAYRKVADRLASESVTDMLSEVYPYVDKYVFVGLNALNECERKLLSKMRSARVAEFCWDYSSEWIKDRNNRSSFFLSSNVSDFGQDISLDPDGLGKPVFNVLAVPSFVGQAKQLPQILQRLDARGMETAVVLPDEGLLVPVLNSIPEHISDINVTMAYPMRSSALWTLMNDLATLQMHMRQKDGKWYFYHKQFWAVFSNGIVKAILDEDTARALEKLKSESLYYICTEKLPSDPVLDVMFKPIVTDPASREARLIRSIGEYQRDVLSLVASRLRGRKDMAVELDFAKEYHLAVGRLFNYELPVMPATYFKLLDKLISRTAVPFTGEPLSGLQIMGPLETRALDVKNVVILNCNEGIFPRRAANSSFIPAELRRGFALPTYEYQDAVWAYYFYRMIQRAENVWMLYDTRTEGVNVGEESRYIKQLELHFGANITRHSFVSGISSTSKSDDIPKLPEDVEIIKQKYMSASSLQDYLECPARFYFEKVKGLSVQDEVVDSLDFGMFGNAYHAAMQELYAVQGGLLTGDYLKNLLKGKRVPEVVDRKILEQLKTFELTGRNLIYSDMICRYVYQTIRRDIELMRSEGVDHIRILGLEQKKNMTIGGIKFFGIIDRLDSIREDVVRIVDYKTGKVSDSDFIINDDNAEAVVEAIFAHDNEERPKIALQLYIYDRFIRDEAAMRGKSIVNSIYQPLRLFSKQVENVRLSGKFCSLMDDALDELLKEITDVQVPFWRASSEKACAYCNFKNLCGR